MSYRIYRNEALEVIARGIISKYDPSLLIEPAPIPVESIMEKVYGLTIEYQYIRKNGRILGETIFEDCMIPIYDSSVKTHPHPYTIPSKHDIIKKTYRHRGDDT